MYLWASERPPPPCQWTHYSFPLSLTHWAFLTLFVACSIFPLWNLTALAPVFLHRPRNLVKHYVSQCVVPNGSAGKESTCKAGDTGDVGLISGSERSPGGGNGNPPQYSCLKNPMDREAWWAAVQRVAKSPIRLSSSVETAGINFFGCKFPTLNCTYSPLSNHTCSPSPLPPSFCLRPLASLLIGCPWARSSLVWWS